MRLKTSALTAALCLALAPAAFAQEDALTEPLGDSAVQMDSSVDSGAYGRSAPDASSDSKSATTAQAGTAGSQPGSTSSPSGTAAPHSGTMSGSQSGMTKDSPAGAAGSMGARTDSMATGKGSGRMGHASMHSSKVRDVQQQLKDKGHDPGAIDGVMGPKTKAALRSFQQAQGLSASGRLDQSTAAALGVDRSGSRASMRDDPSSTTGGAAGRSSTDADKATGARSGTTSTERSGTSSPSTTGSMPGGTTGGSPGSPTTPPSSTTPGPSTGSGTSPR